MKYYSFPCRVVVVVVIVDVVDQYNITNESVGMSVKSTFIPLPNSSFGVDSVYYQFLIFRTPNKVAVTNSSL